MASTEDSNSDDGVFYFAYGSNLSPTQMHDRCPSSTPIGLAHLPGWTWLINQRGYANIVKNQDPIPTMSSSVNLVNNGGTKDTDGVGGEAKEESADKISDHEGTGGVYGVLYRLDPKDEEILDMYEGVPWAYEKQYLEATLLPIPITTATADKDDTNASPQDAEKGKKVQVLAYVDPHRVTREPPRKEYVNRMNRGINEAREYWALPKTYIDDVLRPLIQDKATD